VCMAAASKEQQGGDKDFLVAKGGECACRLLDDIRVRSWSAKSSVMQGASCTQRKVSMVPFVLSIPFVLSRGGSISPDSFLPSILLLVVIIVTVVIVVVILVVVVVAIIGLIIVVAIIGVVVVILILCCLVNVDRMAPMRTSISAAPAMNQAAIWQLIDDCVTATLEAQAANMANTDNTNRNPEPRETHVVRKCTYKEFTSF
nr:hypothetical protein [Tanacetum cinerariifolium]